MSGKLMAQAFLLVELQHGTVRVSSLADHANDDGTKCFPGVEYIAWRLTQNRGQVTSTIIGYARLFGCTVEQAKAVMEEIIDSQVCDSVTEGDGKVTLICRRMSREAKEREGANLRQQRYRNKDRQESDARNGGGGDAAGDAEVTPPSSSSSSSSIHSDDKKRRASQAPDRFPLTPTLREWAKTEAPGIDLDLETKNFLDHHRAKGSLFKDWTASWRTWMRNAATKYAPRHLPACRSPSLASKL
jgi:hypothetical protein